MFYCWSFFDGVLKAVTGKCSAEWIAAEITEYASNTDVYGTQPGWRCR